MHKVEEDDDDDEINNMGGSDMGLSRGRGLYCVPDDESLKTFTTETEDSNMMRSKGQGLKKSFANNSVKNLRINDT